MPAPATAFATQDHHSGRVFGLVRAGSLTHNAANRTVDGVYPPAS
jgi:hypothetical protein